MKTYLKFFKKHENLLTRKLAFTITVSGLSGSGKTTVAREIAKVFKLKIINAGDLFRKYAQQNKMSLDKTSKSFPASIDYEIDKMTLKLAQKGGYVIVGRLSAWVAGEWADCRIFVQSNKKIRDERIAQRDNLSISAARIYVAERDKRDCDRYQKLYKINLKDKAVYNLTVHNNKITLSRLRKEIIQKLKDFLQK